MENKDEVEYVNEVFEVLSSSERRVILQNLMENEYSTGKDIKQSLREQKSVNGNLNINVYHRHLPKLKETGWIDYDDRSDSVDDFDIVFDVDEDDSKDSIVLDYLDQVSDQDEEELDHVFNALQNPLRRRTLYWLREEKGSSNLNQIAGLLATEDTESQEEIYDRTNKDIESLKIDMEHRYLPKLEDAGIISYDSSSKKISLTKDYESPDNLLIQYLERLYD